jgi:glycosyltransferase involved in cell wall biosynthesis
MRLLQINSTVNAGSTGRIVEQIARHCLRRGHDVHIAYGRGAQSSEAQLVRVGSKWNQALHLVGTRLFDTHGFHSKRATRQLVNYIEAYNPDVIQLHNLHGYYLHVGVLAEYLARSRVPVVWTLHDCWPFTGHCCHYVRADCTKWESECGACPLGHLYPASLVRDNSRANFQVKRELFNRLKRLTVVTVSRWLEKQVERSFLASHSLIVLINQAANYLTVGFANAFNQRFEKVALITGSVHVQGEELDPDIEVRWINRWHERPAWKKAFSFALALSWMWLLLLTRYRKYEVFFVSVPPMGYLLNLVLPNRFSMVIWDVYPDTLRITGMKETHPVYRLWAALNRRSFRKAWRIFTISEGMAENLSQYVDRRRLIVQPIWSIFQENSRIPADQNPFVREHGLEGKFVVQYSGNIGVTHNVEALIDVAERLRGDERILFQIIGRGPRQPRIERLIRERNLGNVQMLPFQSDEMFPYSLSAADLGVVILHESVSRGSVPSKAYNQMSFGIPGLYIAGSDSELARYAREYGHARCFAAEDLDGIAQFIRELATDEELHRTMQARAEDASKHFRRGNADRFVESYLAPMETDQ